MHAFAAAAAANVCQLPLLVFSIMIVMQAVQVGLLDRLGRICPKGLDTHIFANSGSEVVENAIKMARAHTKKTNIICFDVRHRLA